jgi:hypothetical protein
MSKTDNRATAALENPDPTIQELREFVHEWLWDCRPYSQERVTAGMSWSREHVFDAAQMIQAFIKHRAEAKDAR